MMSASLSGLVAVACLASVASAQITIATVQIANAGNTPDTRVMLDGTSGFGAVPYVYNIGAYEVTNAEYAAFLRAKAASDPHGLYNPQMAGPLGGIVRTGSPGSYNYVAVRGRAGHPVMFVSFWDACRFANWLHNGQGNGDTETGAYTLSSQGIADNSIVRNPAWKWAVTSENEWYKAAYHQPWLEMGDADDFWFYPTSSNAAPLLGQAHFGQLGGSDTVPVGSYSPNYYGLFDLGGNAWEWNESSKLASRGVRGGAMDSFATELESNYRGFLLAWFETYGFGFRVSQNAFPCTADFDGSGFVDSDDFILFASQFSLGCVGPGDPDPGCVVSADFDGSGFVDSDDFIGYVAAFEAGCL